MASLRKRIEQLEAQLRPDYEAEPLWDLGDRMDAALDKLHVHRCGVAPSQTSGHWYTDAEIRALATAHALEELEDSLGVVKFPSGAAVRVEEGREEGWLTVGFSGRIEAPDLPEGTREYVQRMPADQQLEHEWLWFEEWPRVKEERVFWERERERLRKERIRGNLKHLAELERLGLWWGGSRESHEADKKGLLDSLGEAV